MDPRNPHNSYYYKPMDQAAPTYIPPSRSTRRILPVPQEEGQGTYNYGMPGQARTTYIPDSADRHKEENMKHHPGPEMAMSDRHSKEEIQRLSTKNDALTAALDQAHSAHGGESNMPPTEYPRIPSHTNFQPLPPSPQAQQVMAQNAQMAPPPAPPQMGPPPRPLVPTPQAPQGGPSQGFNVQNGPPDLSQLDEAYRRLGANQG